MMPSLPDNLTIGDDDAADTRIRVRAWRVRCQVQGERHGVAPPLVHLSSRAVATPGCARTTHGADDASHLPCCLPSGL